MQDAGRLFYKLDPVTKQSQCDRRCGSASAGTDNRYSAVRL
ncbi:hypothetical protein ABI_00330 [Asticcacaulis biprosthecium C19]|uniref:Uncharacterized protein n=1 Tax=Asticcacaulis biprosthecium C19 TaxID=715226 RepID=F4QFZ0_9CAUL|nr:hypothetical protein ABI_00330 [Asticcacaulis biprosthecium C19]